MKYFVRRTSILYNYFVSYIVIFAVPLIVLGLGFYNHSVIEMQNQVERYTFDKVVRMRDAFDSALLETRKIALKISSDEQIKPYKVNLNDYHSKNAIDRLNRYWDKNYIDNMFVYFRDDEYVYTVSGKVSFNIMYKIILGVDHNEGEILRHTFQNTRSPVLLGVNGVPVRVSKEEDSLLCLYPFPYGGGGHYGVIGMIIGQRKIENLAGDILGDSRGTLFVYNDAMDRVFTLGDKYFISTEEIQQISLENNSNGISNVKIRGKKLSVINVVSRVSGFRFLLAMSPESYLNRVIAMKNQVIVIICIVLLTGILLAFIFSSKNYRPIKNLFEKVNVYSAVENKEKNDVIKQVYKGFNEIDGIEKIVKDIVKKNDGLIKQLNHHQAFVKDQILLMLIKGKLSNKQSMEELLSLYKMDFKYNYFFVVVISIKKEEDGYGITASELNLYLNGIVENKFRNKEFYCIDTVQGDFVLLFNTSYENCSRIIIENLMKDIKIFLKNNLGLKANIGVGGVYEDILLISRSFMEALSALDYNLLIGYENIIFFNEMVSSDKKAYWYPIEEQMRLAQCIKQGNIYIFRDIIDEIISRIREKQLPIGITRTICFGMINTIIEILNEFDLRNFDSDVEELTQFSSLEDLKYKMEKVVYKICKYISDKKESHNEALKIAIIEYIHENYTNKMLSLDMVAERFGISPKYLSRFFKEQMGFNFVDYVKELRMNYAKKLLSETNCLIKDIVDKIGYSDVASFTRTFRKMEGVTPGEYRKMMTNV